jgi:hypothetical protein
MSEVTIGTELCESGDAATCVLWHAHQAVVSLDRSAHLTFLTEHVTHSSNWTAQAIMVRIATRRSHYLRLLHRMSVLTSGGWAGYVQARPDDFSVGLQIDLSAMAIAVCAVCIPGKGPEMTQPYAFAIAHNGMIHTSQEPGSPPTNPHPTLTWRSYT